MKRTDSIQLSILISLILLAVLFLMPLIVIVPFQSETHSEELVPVEEIARTPFTSGELDREIHLRVLCDGTVQNMDLGTYLLGVVRAEMPASFEQEALCAQAVAARTYTLYQIQSGGRHGETADICTDSACCQAYLSEEKAQMNWGDYAYMYQQKIEYAVFNTDGQVILYQEEPILAVFHSSSAGLTRAAGTVWMHDLPYLQAVTSPENDAVIPNYYSRVEFTGQEFSRRILSSYPEAELSGEMGGWLRKPVVDSAGSVISINVGGIAMKGSRLRSLLGLRSSCFTWEVQEGKLVFFVTGYGHGVGLSQYGANQMAMDGATWLEIVLHYYTDVTVGAYHFTTLNQS